MAKKLQGCDYNSELKKLKNNGPGRVYLLHGPEDYLRDAFLSEIKSICIPEGESGFNYHRFDDSSFNNDLFNKAINSMPFMGEHVLIEVHDPDFTNLTLDDIPEYCTVAFVCKDVDGRLKTVKQIENNLYFSSAEQSSLIKWVRRRFDALGKTISDEAIKRLIFISGDLMNKLIPEIDKIAAYSKDSEVTLSDINKVANHIADADIFEMINYISDRDYDQAVMILSDLQKNSDNSPVLILASITSQYRRLYIAKICGNISKLMDILDIKYDFIANNLIKSAKKFSLSSIKRAITICAETDYLMKSSNGDNCDMLKTLIIKLWKN